jgi:aryl-alcohol dehydrogenase-like predicted oxidoreductase
MDPSKLNGIALGTGQLGLGIDRATSYRMLDAFLDLGGSIIDTAAVYSDWAPGERGRSETVIGEWLGARGRRSDFVLVTKGGHPPLSNVHASRLDPASLRADIEQSLRRLRTDHIDLYLLHRDDRARPVAEIMGVLDQYVQSGALAAVGCSNWRPDRIAEGRRLMGSKLAATQILGNALSNLMNPVADQTLVKLDAEALQQARDANLILMLFTSQAQGALTKLGRGLPPDYDNPACRKAIGELNALAGRVGIDVNALGLAYLLQLTPTTVAVTGPKTMEQLEQSLMAASITLEPETIAEIGRITGIR